jgi:hypothetical protein
MKKVFIFIYTVYSFLFVLGSVHGIGERTLLLGGDSGWRTAENRAGIVEVTAVRPNPVLILCSTTGPSTAGYSAASGTMGNFAVLTESALDMSLSFDEGNSAFFRDSAGNYWVSSPGVTAANRKQARAGTGAALFDNSNLQVSPDSPLVIEPRTRNALFAPGSRMRDFTIEFWIYPMNLENGEQILSWVSSRPVNGSYAIQRILCTASRNRLQWSFENFFASSGGSSHINIEFSGDSPVVPKRWSHHLVRFDAANGMIEYLVDGVSETIVYATPTRREGAEVFTPIAGNGGAFVIGGRFSGLMDEFKIHSVFAARSSIQKYASSGGRVETSAIDLGEYNSDVLRVDVAGGRNGSFNEFRSNGRFRFADDTEMQFFIRVSDNPYLMNNSVWTGFTPGADIQNIRGRYVQLAVDFYPSADGETSPYLDYMRIVYIPGEPPLPPGNFTASAVDGGVMLHWKHSPDINTAGYLVYYSSIRGELFGADAALGLSPIDVGKRNSLLIEGLKNGTLYYFRIASYDHISGSSVRNIGEFSREVTARPLEGLLLSAPPN